MEPVRSPFERRSSERSRCSHLAEIRIGSSFVLRAIVKDLSEKGAKLQLPRDSWLPKSFDICIPDTGLQRKAVCRWRRGEYAGLEFAIIAE
ncbi:PilZ domain-containing protein [Oricola indica]|uniref:PilZ domain-containing protein n=1 Tax=Oricola indica TaxID=2872591 RepID=UPI003CCBA6A3